MFVYVYVRREGNICGITTRGVTKRQGGSPFRRQYRGGRLVGEFYGIPLHTVV